MIYNQSPLVTLSILGSGDSPIFNLCKSSISSSLITLSSNTVWILQVMVMHICNLFFSESPNDLLSVCNRLQMLNFYRIHCILTLRIHSYKRSHKLHVNILQNVNTCIRLQCNWCQTVSVCCDIVCYNVGHCYSKWSTERVESFHLSTQKHHMGDFAQSDVCAHCE